MSADSHICSFCEKDYRGDDVLLVSCSTAKICSNCVELCRKIIEEKRKERELHLRSWVGMGNRYK